MKQLTLFFLGIASCLMLSGCKNDFQGNYDYLIFGHFYGECMGEVCRENFKLEEGRLFEDQNDTYPGGFSGFIGDWERLSKARYDLVSELPMQIPSLLLQHPDTIFGQPDAGDWGGLYLEYSVEGQVHIWYLDQQTNNMPAELAPIVVQVNAAIEAAQ